jgi:hypothetical protein
MIENYPRGEWKHIWCHGLNIVLLVSRSKTPEEGMDQISTRNNYCFADKSKQLLWQFSIQKKFHNEAFCRLHLQMSMIQHLFVAQIFITKNCKKSQLLAQPIICSNHFGINHHSWLKPLQDEPRLLTICIFMTSNKIILTSLRPILFSSSHCLCSLTVPSAVSLWLWTRFDALHQSVALLHFLYPPSTAEPSCRGKVFGCNPFHPKPTAKNKFYLRMPSWGNFFDSFPRIIWKNFKVNLEQQKILSYSSISVKNIEDLCFLNEFLPKQSGNIRARTKKVLPAILDTVNYALGFSH